MEVTLHFFFNAKHSFYKNDIVKFVFFGRFLLFNLDINKLVLYLNIPKNNSSDWAIIFSEAIYTGFSPQS